MSSNRKSIKMSSLVLSLVLILGMAQFNLVAATKELKDVKSSDWYYNTVNYMINRGAVNGYSDATFKPNNTITRMEFVKLLVAALYTEVDLQQTDAIKLELVGVADSHWSARYFKRAEATKMIDEVITSYYDYSAKGVEQPITRGEIAYLLMNVEETVLSQYLEIDKVFGHDRGYYMYMIPDVTDEYYQIAESAVRCFQYGIVSGYSDNTFRSSANATRAEATTMAARLFVAEYRKTTHESAPQYPKNAKGERTFRESCFVRPKAVYTTNYDYVYDDTKSGMYVAIDEYIGYGFHYYYDVNTVYQPIGYYFIHQYQQNFNNEEDKTYDAIYNMIAPYVKDTKPLEKIMDQIEMKMNYVVSNYGSDVFVTNIVGIDGITYQLVAEVSGGRDDASTYLYICRD